MSQSFIRGTVLWCDVGQGEKPWLVVSNNQRNRRLRSALVVRITSSPKPELASIVVLKARDQPLVGRVLCDDITTLYEDDGARPGGALSSATMAEVDAALGAALGLVSPIIRFSESQE